LFLRSFKKIGGIFFRKKDNSDFLEKSEIFLKKDTTDFLKKSEKSFSFFKKYPSNFLGKSDVFFWTFHIKDITLAVKNHRTN